MGRQRAVRGVRVGSVCRALDPDTHEEQQAHTHHPQTPHGLEETAMGRNVEERNLDGTFWGCCFFFLRKEREFDKNGINLTAFKCNHEHINGMYPKQDTS